MITLLLEVVEFSILETRIRLVTWFEWLKLRWPFEWNTLVSFSSLAVKITNALLPILTKDALLNSTFTSRISQPSSSLYLEILLSVHPIQTLQYQFFICNDGESALDNIKWVWLDIDVCWHTNLYDWTNWNDSLFTHYALLTYMFEISH